MKKRTLFSRSITITIIIVVMLGSISAVGAKLYNDKLNGLIDSATSQLDESIAAMGKLIEEGQNPALLQQQLESAAGNTDAVADLLVIDSEATIIAASDNTAIGKTYPISFVTNVFRGIPIPFTYKKTEIPVGADLYKVIRSPDLMFKIFGIYKSPDSRAYYIMGNYHVSPDLTARQNQLTRMVVTFMTTYRVCFILFWLLLTLWVYIDARQRSANAAAWGILTLLTSVIGWAIYLIARPIVNICPACGQEQSSDLKFCTACGTAVKTCCPQCGSALTSGWEYCGVCGHKLHNQL